MECWESEKNMQFSGCRLSLPEAGNSSPWKTDLWSTTSRTLHAIISGMRETRQASVFAVLAPPPHWGAPWLDAKPRDVWAVHCVGWTLKAASLPVLMITLPVFKTAASKADGPPAGTLCGQSRTPNLNTTAVLVECFFMTSLHWGQIFQFSDHLSWLKKHRALVVVVQRRPQWKWHTAALDLNSDPSCQAPAVSVLNGSQFPMDCITSQLRSNDISVRRGRGDTEVNAWC